MNAVLLTVLNGSLAIASSSPMGSGGSRTLKWTPLFGPRVKVDIGSCWSRISWPQEEGHDAADTTSV